jgi:hypothetical protein
MAEYGSVGPGLAVVMDGTGYGEDGTVWGGEFLEVTLTGYRRLGHLRYIPLPGGDMAVREPWRMGAAYLERIYGDLEGCQIPFTERVDLERWSQIRLAVRAQINSPPCSSMGRLFDAVSALVGVRETVNYEGQAAIELEQMVEEGNQLALEIMEEVFEPVSARWRGLGMIPESGLTLREEFKEMDAALVFDIPYKDKKDPPGCLCGEILQGLKSPPDCPLFDTRCTPEMPVGPCMVSSEGSCAAFHKYGVSR